MGYGYVPSSPTDPRASGLEPARPVGPAPGSLDVADVFPSAAPLGTAGTSTALDEKLRRAYYWMVNEAIISPHYDIEFEMGDGAPDTTVNLGETGAALHLPTAPSYSSFMLMPLLTFAVRGRCLLIGGPGRGKTTSAILMGVLAGYPVEQVRRGMQHGHPQLSVTDMFGTPLPRDLVGAESLADIDVAWRSWLGMRVKIIDEYNRIPTRTQSALLTVLADGYVEVYDQLYETGDAAWYLTANDDAGGGTYQVVEALRDRIDITVAALPFNPRFLPGLIQRREGDFRPERHVPAEVVFSAAEHDAISAQIQSVRVPQAVLRRLAFFASQLEVCEHAATQLEYRSKDTARLTGGDVAGLLRRSTGRDRLTDLADQTLSGMSVRAMNAVITYAKAMAFFRGHSDVALEDLRAVLPFVLRDKIQPNLDSPVFASDEGRLLVHDPVSWLRGLMDTACLAYDAAGLDTDDPVGEVLAELHQGLTGVTHAEVRHRLARIESLARSLGYGGKLYGHVADDAMALKYAHQRYSAYMSWLEWDSGSSAGAGP